MTGICGIWTFETQEEPAVDLCKRMQRALKMYGPDKSATWNGGEIAFGLELAKLLPEDRYDRQPLSGDGGRIRLLTDVRLDNRPELAAELGLTSEQTAVMADSDYVLAAWRAWGVDCLEKLYGDYAIAVWDDQARVLHLARDPLGRRPLFLHSGHGFLAFASMAKGIHALPYVERAPDLQTLEDFLALAPMRGPRSFFAGVERVEPGQRVEIRPGPEITRTMWYDWDVDRDPKLASDEAYVEHFRAVFDRAVAERLRGVGPVAAQLSGGLDSSAVAASAALQLMKAGRTLNAYTHVPSEELLWETPRHRIPNEWPQAAELAALYPNINHVKISSGNRQIADDMISCIEAFETPTTNVCNQVWGSQIERSMVAIGDKILITGEAGNMTISQTGFEQLPQLLRRGKLKTWLTQIHGLLQNGYTFRDVVVMRSILANLPAKVGQTLKRMRGEQVFGLADFSALNRDTLRSPRFRRRMRDLRYSPSGNPFIGRRELAVFVLRRMDLAGQHNKGLLAQNYLDMRDPTADRRLVEFTLWAPDRIFLQGGEPRWLYGQAFVGRIPAQSVGRREKGYQSADWFPRLKASVPLISRMMDEIGDSAMAHTAVDLTVMKEDLQSLSAASSPSPQNTLRFKLRFLRALSVTQFSKCASTASREQRPN